MPNELSLRSLLLLLTVSCLVSGGRSLSLENAQNTTISSFMYNNETEPQPTSGPLQTTGIGEEQSAAAPTPGQNTSEMVHIQPSQGNVTSGNLYSGEGTETYSSTHQSAGNGSLSGTESSPQTSIPQNNGSSDPTTLNSTLTISPSVEGNETNATNSAPVVKTTPRMVTDGPFTSRTTVKLVVPSSTEITTASAHTPTTPHSTKKTDKSTTNFCPTAEPKREGLVGRCLIAIASLAALATFFVMTTIILATKLSASRYRHRASMFHDTEMVCISALMNDSDHPMPTQRRPKSNGALIPITEDDDGDDLTLNSFLHDTEGVA